MTARIILTPAQRKAGEGLRQACGSGSVHVLRGKARSGKTTVLKWLHVRCGGSLLDAGRLLEEPFLTALEQSLERNDLLLVDDLHLVANRSRDYLLDAALTTLLAEAAVRSKTLVFAIEGSAPFPVRRRASVWEIADRDLPRAASAPVLTR